MRFPSRRQGYFGIDRRLDNRTKVLDHLIREALDHAPAGFCGRAFEKKNGNAADHASSGAEKRCR
jgi:hypothetical protein